MGGTRLVDFLLVCCVLIPLASAYDTWCGKYYEPFAPRSPPSADSYFRLPPTSSVDLLDFRCTLEKSIYLDAELSGNVIIDVNVTRDVGTEYHGTIGSQGHVVVYDGSKLLASSPIDISTLGTVLPFDLSFEPSLTPRQLACVLTVEDQVFENSAELYFLPRRSDGGSAVRLDRLSGGVEVYDKGRWEATFPFGWYDEKTSSGSWWDSNVSMYPGLLLMVDAQGQFWPGGFNLIHPVPPWTSYAHEGDETAIHQYFADADQLGMGVMYDMRHGYTDLDLVRTQVHTFKSKPALWFWYTADEPDGPGLAHDSTARARDVIREVDPYHPVALVLNCQNHYWTEYTRGADILLVDVYSIAMNPLWSKKWSTEITPTFGCSGCDGCRGEFADLSRRMDLWSDWTRLSGRTRTLPMWVVPQGFDDNGDEFWWRVPEGQEVGVQIILGINHGAMGHCAWLASGSTPEILSNASDIARQIYAVKDFIVKAGYTRRRILTTLEDAEALGVDIFGWTIRLPKGRVQTLLLAAHLHYTPKGSTIDFSPLGVSGRIRKILFGQVEQAPGGGIIFKMDRVSIAGVILERYEDEDEVPLDTGSRIQMAVSIAKEL